MTYKLTVNDLNIDNYGAIKLPISGIDFFSNGFEMLDLVEIEIAGKKNVCPVVPDYNYIDNGVCAIAMVNGINSNVYLLANGGQFVILLDVAKRTREGWVLNPRISFPLDITFTLSKRKGYQKTYDVYAYLFSRRSNNRKDYPELSDTDYANFRTVTGGSIKPNILYRSSSPILNRFNRNKFVDIECKKANIKKMINLSESDFDIKKLSENEAYKDCYYLKQEICALSLPADYKDFTFIEGMKKGLLFMIKDKNKTLIHCMEGKDRTGFVVAVLQALMGASMNDIMNDYIKSHCNFFKLDLNDKTASLVKLQINDYLSDNFSGPINNKNLADEAYKYLVNIGLKPAEVNQIKSYLRGE